jgi:hypothetical protein
MRTRSPEEVTVVGVQCHGVLSDTSEEQVETKTEHSPTTITKYTPRSTTMCSHQPVCPTADASDHDAARVVHSHPEQGWVLLCNGVVVFDDTGEILPDRQVVAPHRNAVRQVA